MSIEGALSASDITDLLQLGPPSCARSIESASHSSQKSRSMSNWATRAAPRTTALPGPLSQERL